MHPRTAILVAAAVVYVVGEYVPGGQLALYPLTLFTTWVHEMGHGMTAVLVGGHFSELEIFKDAPGLAMAFARTEWGNGLVGLGGLLAPPIVGALLIAVSHGPRRARIALALLALALVLSLIFYVRSTTGWIAMPIVALALGWSAWKAAPEYRVIACQVLGVVLALDTMTRMISYVFTKQVTVDGQTGNSDIQNVASTLGGSYVLWGMLVTTTAVCLLGGALWWAHAKPPSRPR